MELFKNTAFMTALWILFGIAVIVLGVYREHLYREKNNQQQKELMEMQKRVLEEQTAIKNTVNKLVKQGTITEGAAQEILKTVVSSQVTVKDEVLIKLLPADEMSSKENK
jgi:signal transduction histidine kinase